MNDEELVKQLKVCTLYQGILDNACRAFWYAISEHRTDEEVLEKLKQIKRLYSQQTGVDISDLPGDLQVDWCFLMDRIRQKKELDRLNPK